ncbi:MAG: FAD-dependent oxidoreductase [Proteobacteria bacterium]|nr:FAD-dependent oxidoreductase [Pseudomonadota bacterium]MBU1709632.1 FAD-dependent oxidoreductase [Pseudomonadota bacterium]
MVDYLIIGSGVAGLTAAEEIRKQDQKGSITIISEEDLPFYYRIRLNDFIAGEIPEEKLVAKNQAWYDEQKIIILTETRVIGADPETRTVFTDDNQEISYKRLLIATGSHSFVPPIPGTDLEGVFALRDISDARAIAHFADNITNAVIIGGGLLGLETGDALARLGKIITVVEFSPRLLPRQLDGPGASLLQGFFEKSGFSFRLDARTREINGTKSVTGVTLESGETLEAQMVIISAGVRPNMELAAPLGLKTDKGIQINQYMETSVNDIYAAGDVCQFQEIPPYGIWPAASQQGRIAGANMAGDKLAYSGTTISTKLKVAGIDLASAGEIDPENKFDCRIDSQADRYKKIVIDQNRIIGCILLGDTKKFTKYTKAITEKTELQDIPAELIPQ